MSSDDHAFERVSSLLQFHVVSPQAELEAGREIRDNGIVPRFGLLEAPPEPGGAREVVDIPFTYRPRPRDVSFRRIHVNGT